MAPGTTPAPPVRRRVSLRPPTRLEPMPQPKLATFPAIRGALRFYQIASVITGVMLLLLCAEMLIKYAFGYELFLGGSGGFLWFAPVVETATPKPTEVPSATALDDAAASATTTASASPTL